MKRILLDTNVLFDVLVDRQGHAAASSSVWSAVEAGVVEGYLSAHSVTTIHHLVRKEKGPTAAIRTIAALLRVFSVAAVDAHVLSRALELQQKDFEDAVTSAAAEKAKCDAIVSRDSRGFAGSPVRCLTPEAAASALR